MEILGGGAAGGAGGLVTRQRAHVARLAPTAAQAVRLDAQGHAARALWNLIHAWWLLMGPRGDRRATPKRADAAVRQARKDLDWLAVLPAQAAQQVLKTYHRAWVNCWEHRARTPKFKARDRTRMSVDVPQGRDLKIVRINRRWGQVNLPRVGKVRFRWTKDLPGVTKGSPSGRVTGARLVKDPLGWHIVFRTETAAPAPAPHPGPRVGVDRGVVVPLALSDGSAREHGPWLTGGETERLRRLEKHSARQRRTRPRGAGVSNRLRHTYDQIAGLRAKAKRRAVDWQHKTTTELADSFGVIGVEALNIGSMVRSARGTVTAPGTNVRQKAGLNRAIAGEAWGRTVDLLAYKAADRGGRVIKVPAPNTSRRCHRCRTVTEGSRVDQARFACRNPGCGWVGNADVNGACNVDVLVGEILRTEAADAVVAAASSVRRE